MDGEIIKEDPLVKSYKLCEIIAGLYILFDLVCTAFSNQLPSWGRGRRMEQPRPIVNAIDLAANHTKRCHRLNNLEKESAWVCIHGLRGENRRIKIPQIGRY